MRIYKSWQICAAVNSGISMMVRWGQFADRQKVLALFQPVINSLGVARKVSRAQHSHSMCLKNSRTLKGDIGSPANVYGCGGIQFVEKDPKLADTVLRGLLKFWPVTNSQKEVLFLGEMEEILELTQVSHRVLNFNMRITSLC